MLGFSNDELYSRPINDFIHPDDREITSQFRYELTLSKPLLNFENRYVTKSGEVVWLSWTSHPVESDQVIFAIAKNVTHKKKLEEERNMLIAGLSQINNELKQLTYTVSHDLRAPVTNLLSIYELLDTSKINDRQIIELIEFMKAATENLKQTVNNYVDRLSNNDDIKLMEELDLPEVLNGVVKSIKSLIINSKTTLSVVFSQWDKVTFYKANMESILLNLITNAIKYARPGTDPVISISTRQFNGRYQLLVADNGMGFDMEKVKDKIFGLHQKFHDHADSKGIGLYLVYNHITNSGGKIEVKSAVNIGTTFTISFRK